MSQEAQNAQAAAPESVPAAAPPPMFRWFDSAGVDDIYTVICEFLRRCDEQATGRAPRERLADVLAAAYSPDERRVLIRQMGTSPEEVAPGAKIAAEEAWTIIEYFERRRRFEDLLARVRRDRPGAFLPSVNVAMSALLAGVDPRFVATLPTGGTPADCVFVVLHRLNRTERLDDGTVPFAVWLRAAMQLIGPIPEADVLRRALVATQQPYSGSAPASLLVPPAAKPMGRAVLRFEIPFETFTERERGMMLHALAGLLKLSVEEIRVEKIEAGSVKVTIVLPEEAAARLALLNLRPPATIMTQLLFRFPSATWLLPMHHSARLAILRPDNLLLRLGYAVLNGAHLTDANLSDANLYGADLQGANLRRADLQSADLQGANLSGADLTGANLSGADLRRTDLTRADLTGTNLTGANLFGANLTGADLTGANLTGTDLRRTDLTRADLTGANLTGAGSGGIVGQPSLPAAWRLVRGYLIGSGADLAYVKLHTADLQGADLQGANLSGANLRRADLQGADLQGANLREAKLTGANLHGADLRRTDLTRADLTRANLTDANLTDANLTGANLTGADLSGADLSGANLSGAGSGGIVGQPSLPAAWRLVRGYLIGSGADLSGADLSGADLSGADLSGANLSGANLTSANLTGANLFGANLAGANLSGADLTSANLNGAGSGGIVGQPGLPAAWRLVRGYLIGSGANLTGAHLTGANLTGANLTSADLRQAKLTGANLHGADLREADLREADLREADLTGANLTSADLRQAKLTGANLHGADLREADLREADLRGADIENADFKNAALQGAAFERTGRDFGVPDLEAHEYPALESDGSSKGKGVA